MSALTSNFEHKMFSVSRQHFRVQRNYHKRIQKHDFTNYLATWCSLQTTLSQRSHRPVTICENSQATHSQVLPCSFSPKRLGLKWLCHNAVRDTLCCKWQGTISIGAHFRHFDNFVEQNVKRYFQNHQNNVDKHVHDIHGFDGSESDVSHFVPQNCQNVENEHL